MKVKTRNTKWPRFRTRKKKLALRVVLLALAGLVLGVYSGAVFFAGIGTKRFLEKRLLDYGSTSAGLRFREIGAPVRLKQRLKNDLQNFRDNLDEFAQDAPEVETLVLDIKHKHVVKLNDKREEALKLGQLQSDPDDFVPATVRHRGETIRVQIRLKGDLLDHLSGKKWSYRVKVKDGNDILGMRVFSLQHPKTRVYQQEFLFQDHMRSEGVLAVRHRLVELVVNGDSRGLMDMEEHFSKELIESQGRRDGVILHFDERLFWESVALNDPEIRSQFLFSEEFPLILPYRPTKIAESPQLMEQARIGTGLLRGFLEGTLEASDVFDAGQWGRFLAVYEIWDQWHGLVWTDLRFYFNPITAKLEPIGFDAGSPVRLFPPSHLLNSVDERVAGFSARILRDPAILRAFLQALHRLAGEVERGEIRRTFAEKEKTLRSVLLAEFPLLGRWDFDAMERRARQLKKVNDGNYAYLRRSELRYPDFVQALLIEDNGEDWLEVVNLLDQPVEVVRVTIHGTSRDKGEPVQVELLDDLPLTLAPTTRERVTVKRLGLQLEDLPVNLAAEVFARTPDRNDVCSVKAVSYPPAASRPVIPSGTVERTLADHPFLSWDEGSRQFIATQGTWIMKGDLILPPGAGLKLLAGTTLRFGTNGVLLSTGPLVFLGTPTEPVVLDAIHTTDTTEQASWSGLAVLGPDAPSKWENVVVRRTAGISRGGWTLTGGITFYDCEVRMEDCLIEHTTAEDALNTVQARFDFKRLVIKHTVSDAFDADSCEGVVTDGEFEDIDGDGIDVSGSTVSVRGTQLRGIRDKAISVGERSSLTAQDVVIEDVGVGLAGKDLSKAVLSNSKMTNVAHVAVMSYTKKSEFGPGRVEVKAVQLDNVGRDFVSQTGSVLIVDGSVVATESIDIDALYDTGFMKKK